MNFFIDDDILDLNISVAIVIIRGMKNSEENADFSLLRDKILSEIKEHLTEEEIINDTILQGFWELHKSIGKTSKHDVSSPENLTNMLLRNGSIPSINLIVDIYNLVSLKTSLALGAHDLNHINGNVSLRLTDGSENFLPIGYSKPKQLSKGEYAYIDDNNDVLCRMEVRQVEKTKVLESTTDCMYIIQGNKNVSNDEIKEAVDMLVQLTLKYCGGKEEIIYKQY